MLVRKTNYWRTILKMFVFQEENLEDFSFFLPFLLNTYNYLTHQALDLTWYTIFVQSNPLIQPLRRLLLLFEKGFLG